MDRYVKRDAEDIVRKYLELFGGVIITGPRRAGKTRLAVEVGKNVGAEFVSMDDPLELEYFESKPKFFAKRHPSKYLILDEVQYAENAGRTVKYLIDVEKRKVIATGSSAEPISKNIMSYLVGRVGIVELFPFSIGEFFRARGLENAYPEEKEEAVREHVKYGGYPEAVLAGRDREAVLKNMLITAVQRDAARIANAREREVMRTVLAIAATEGNTIEYSSIARSAGVKYSKAREIVDALEISYLVHVVRPYHRNKASELRKAPKIYFTDTGVKHAVEGKYGDVVGGSDVETLVLSELLKAGYRPKYWRTKGGAEVDFVVEAGLETVPIEVKTAWDGGVPSGLREFISTYGESTPVAIITHLRADTDVFEYRGAKLVKCPVWELRGVLHHCTESG